MSPLNYTRAGTGEPLVLLHGIGLTKESWAPVVPELARHFDVLAVDLPGFGESAALPAEVEPTPADLALAVAGLLDRLGIDRPHVVGNSLGGWVALELAQRRPVASLTLLSPAGLWRGRIPFYCRVSLGATRWLTAHAPRLLARVSRGRAGRYLLFRQSHGRPGRLTPDQCRAAIVAMGACAGFPATLRATAHRRFTSTTTIFAPVTVAFGSRDALLLPGQARHVEQLPPHSRVATLVGCGHVPMNDDPAAVVGLIRSAARTGGQVREEAL